MCRALTGVVLIEFQTDQGLGPENYDTMEKSSLNGYPVLLIESYIGGQVTKFLMALVLSLRSIRLGLTPSPQT